MVGQTDEALAQRLRELRLCSRLTQTQIAHAIGVTKGTLGQYERGRICIPYKRHAAIAQALGCRQTALYDAPGTGLPKRRLATPQRVRQRRSVASIEL